MSMEDKRAKPNESSRQSGNEKPVTLAPLSFDEALDGLLAVKPQPKVEPEKATKNRATKKRK